MTRKDYVLIAEAIKQERDDSWAEAELVPLRALANRLARMLELENSRFDRARFLRACGF